MSKFDAVPVEEDTVRVAALEVKFGDYDVLYEKWLWESYQGETLVFVTDEIANLSESEFESQLRSSELLNVGTNISITHSKSGYTFVTFNVDELDLF